MTRKNKSAHFLLVEPVIKETVSGRLSLLQLFSAYNARQSMQTVSVHKEEQGQR